MQFAWILFDKNSEKHNKIMKKTAKLYNTNDAQWKIEKSTRTNMDYEQTYTKKESENKTIFRVANRQTIEMRASLLLAWYVLLQFLTVFFLRSLSQCGMSALVMSIFGN